MFNPHVFYQSLGYLFGAGRNDFYSASMLFYKSVKNPYKRKIEQISGIIDKTAKGVLRSFCTFLSMTFVYYALKNNNNSLFGLVIISESIRQLSIQIDKKNKKDLEDRL